MSSTTATLQADAATSAAQNAHQILKPWSDPARYPSRPLQARDLQAVSALHDAVFGPGALARAAYRVREGQPDFTPFCRVLHDGDRLIAAVRYTAVTIGGQGGALLLGPLMVDPDYGRQGHSRRLVSESLKVARESGVRLVLLVGDESYYSRFGFVPVTPSGRITMPAPVDPRRLLGSASSQDALAAYTGLVRGAN